MCPVRILWMKGNCHIINIEENNQPVVSKNIWLFCRLFEAEREEGFLKVFIPEFRGLSQSIEYPDQLQAVVILLVSVWVIGVDRIL